MQLRMKRLIIILISFMLFGFKPQDNPFFEQIAFNLYHSEIIEAYPVDKKVRVFESSFDFHPDIFWFNTPKCLEGIIWKNNEQFQSMSTELTIDNLINASYLDYTGIDKKKFKVKKNGKGSYPKLFVSRPHIEEGDDKRIFVNIYEEHSQLFTVIYHIEFDSAGSIIDWCRSENQRIVIS